MARIVKTDFVLTLPNGEKKQFAVGEQVTDEQAKHWYVAAHTDELEAPTEAPTEAPAAPAKGKK